MFLVLGQVLVSIKMFGGALGSGILAACGVILLTLSFLQNIIVPELAMDYEKEQEYLQRLFEEVETDIDDDNASLTSDHEEIQDHNTDDEQTIEPIDLDVPLSGKNTGQQSAAFYIGKHGKTHWRKHPGNKQVRTRADNIIKVLPGVKKNAKGIKSPLEIWSLFFPDNILNVIVENTNIFIGMGNYDTSNRTARPTDIIELKALFGLLYISAMSKNNHVNAADLFRTNGTSMEIFRLTMSVQRFKFLLRYIRFDDKGTREERQRHDKLAPIREVFDAFNSNLPKYFSLSEYTTVDEMLAAFRGKCGFRVYMPNKPNRYGIKICIIQRNWKFILGSNPLDPSKCKQIMSPFYLVFVNQFPVVEET
nr:piggyBac transposable element-derived protein 4-like [Onthophagus taurus]